MNQKSEVLDIAKKNNGIILTKQVSDAKISRKVLNTLEKEGKIFKMQRGVYVTEDGYVDDYYLLQLRYPKGVFSHETALYILGYSLRVPTRVNMTFEQGTSTTRMKKDNIIPTMISNHFCEGIIEVKISGGVKIRVYNIERTLIDLLKPRYDVDFEQLFPAINKYVLNKDKDINKLYNYAKLFRLEGEIIKYFGGY